MALRKRKMCCEDQEEQKDEDRREGEGENQTIICSLIEKFASSGSKE